MEKVQTQEEDCEVSTNELPKSSKKFQEEESLKMSWRKADDLFAYVSTAVVSIAILSALVGICVVLPVQSITAVVNSGADSQTIIVRSVISLAPAVALIAATTFICVRFVRFVCTESKNDNSL